MQSYRFYLQNEPRQLVPTYWSSSYAFSCDLVINMYFLSHCTYIWGFWLEDYSLPSKLQMPTSIWGRLMDKWEQFASYLTPCSTRDSSCCCYHSIPYRKFLCHPECQPGFFSFAFEALAESRSVFDFVPKYTMCTIRPRRLYKNQKASNAVIYSRKRT